MMQQRGRTTLVREQREFNMEAHRLARLFFDLASGSLCLILRTSHRFGYPYKRC
jgi:hypothetical protein